MLIFFLNLQWISIRSICFLKCVDFRFQRIHFHFEWLEHILNSMTKPLFSRVKPFIWPPIVIVWPDWQSGIGISAYFELNNEHWTPQKPYKIMLLSILRFAFWYGRNMYIHSFIVLSSFVDTYNRNWFGCRI